LVVFSPNHYRSYSLYPYLALFVASCSIVESIC
jgi:hypothetical protein